MRKIGMGVNENNVDPAAEIEKLKKENAELAEENAELKEALKVSEQKNKTGAGKKKGAATEDPEEQNTAESGAVAEE